MNNKVCIVITQELCSTWESVLLLQERNPYSYTRVIDDTAFNIAPNALTKVSTNG